MNNIEFAKVYNKFVGERFAIKSKTNVLVNAVPVEYNGGSEIKIPKLSVDGMANLDGYAFRSGDVNFEYETKKLEWYRGRKYNIGRYDVNDTNFTLTAANILNKAVEDVLVPETDKLRLGKAALEGIAAGNVSSYAPAAATIFEQFTADVAALQDKCGEDKVIYAFMSSGTKKILENSTSISKSIELRDMSEMGINTKIAFIDNVGLIACPAAYMKSIFNAVATGGVEADAAALNVNWVLIAKGAFTAAAFPTIQKVIDPDTNQNGDCWTIDLGCRHGAFALEAEKGIAVSVDAESGLPALYLESEAGTVAVGDTVLTLFADSDKSIEYAAPAGYDLYVMLDDSAITAPEIGSKIDNTYVPYIDGSTYAAGDNTYGIVVLAANGNIVAATASTALVKKAS